jgi:hypothetical protein
LKYGGQRQEDWTSENRSFTNTKLTGAAPSPSYASRTRFIPDALAPHFDATTWPLGKEPIDAYQGKPFNIDAAAIRLHGPVRSSS